MLRRVNSDSQTAVVRLQSAKIIALETCFRRFRGWLAESGKFSLYKRANRAKTHFPFEFHAASR
ncbi:hypothetical protein [Asticcacaulis taihuensis]|uniref:hypothetical protein n=1 Tax=Asticcacaulis taihuensis TaxID=260084 RepID=UPI003F7C4400